MDKLVYYLDNIRFGKLRQQCDTKVGIKVRKESCPDQKALFILTKG
ncbi:MAG: hypothetical protein LKE40_04440 [Spirochaetia bacterium]|jgi:hypothetical protein|nr:hypothetical protein [Spirochaetia bacterium]